METLLASPARISARAASSTRRISETTTCRGTPGAGMRSASSCTDGSSRSFSSTTTGLMLSDESVKPDFQARPITLPVLPCIDHDSGMPSIQLRTAVPGPKSQALSDRRVRAVARGVSQLTPIFVARSDGAVVEDVDGNHFLDFAGGIGCLNTGHRAPGVVAAVHAQADRFLHTCFMVAPYESYVRVAEKLNQLAPGPTPKKTLLLNSGAEAVENAIKIARAYTKRPAVICFEDAFHGRTLLTLSLTSKTHPYKAGFEPMASDVYRIPYANQYRCESGTTAEEFAHHLEDAFKRHVAAENVAAVI